MNDVLGEKSDYFFYFRVKCQSNVVMNNLKANLHATIYRPDFVHITDRKKNCISLQCFKVYWFT